MGSKGHFGVMFGVGIRTRLGRGRMLGRGWIYIIGSDFLWFGRVSEIGKNLGQSYR
jgi:hypothetical protein